MRSESINADQHNTSLPVAGSDADVLRKLLSGNRAWIKAAAAQIKAAGRADEFVLRLLAARRRGAERKRRIFGKMLRFRQYSERERHSALTSLHALWGGLGREIGIALDQKATHFDREAAHRALVRRRDQRAVPALVDALRSGFAPEDWRVIATLGVLGDSRAANALIAYVDLQYPPDERFETAGGTLEGADPDSTEAARPRGYDDVLNVGIEIGRALRSLSARAQFDTAIQGIRSTKAAHRAGAVMILAGWGDAAYYEQIVPFLQDETRLVREAAALGLGELRELAAFEPLMALQHDPSAEVRRAAEWALEQIRIAYRHRTAQQQKMVNYGLPRRKQPPDKLPKTLLK